MLYRMVRPGKRQGTANLEYRRRIPADVRAAAIRRGRLEVPLGPATVPVAVTPGTQSIRLSLRTADPIEVKARARAVDAYLDRVWHALRQREPVALTHRQAVALAGKVYRAWADDGRERTTAMEHNPKTGLWEPAAPPLPDDRAAEWTAVLKRGEALRNDDPADLEPAFGPIIDRLLLAEGIGELEPRSRNEVLYEVWRALQDAFAARKRQAEGDYSPDPKAERFPEWTPPAPREAGRQDHLRAAAGNGATLTALVEEWWREAKATGLAVSTYESYRNTMRRFAAFLKHGDPHKVTPADVVAFKDHRLAEINPRTGKPVSPKTVKDSDLAGLRRVFGWAVSNRRMASNPAEGITLKLGRQSRPRDKAFTPDEARAALRHAHTYRRRSKGEHPKTAAAKRWAPWLCAYTGARVGEVLQLRKQDVKRDGDVWFITITPEAGTVKDGRARDVPLHPHLIELGFVEFATAAGEGYLFLDVVRGEDPRGKWRTAKNRVREFIRMVVTDPDVAPNHAWRHLFKSVGFDVGIQERVLDAICGHAPRTVGATYGTISLRAKADAMAKIPRFMVGR